MTSEKFVPAFLLTLCALFAWSVGSKGIVAEFISDTHHNHFYELIMVAAYTITLFIGLAGVLLGDRLATEFNWSAVALVVVAILLWAAAMQGWFDYANEHIRTFWVFAVPLLAGMIGLWGLANRWV